MPLIVEICEAEWDTHLWGEIVFDVYLDSWLVFCIEMTGILIQRGLLELFTLAPGGGGVNMHPTCISSHLGWGWYLRWRKINVFLCGQCTKGIWMESDCGSGLSLDMRVRPNWIPLGISIGRILVHSSWRPVAHLLITLTNYRAWKSPGNKSTRQLTPKVG